MGGAQPLAVTMNEGVILCVDMQPQCIERRLKTKYLDVQAQNLDEALKLALDAVDNKKPLSIGLCANVVDVLEELLKRNVKIDLMTDQTSAHDELNGYFPQGLTLKEALELRKQNPKNYIERSLATMKKHVELMQEFQKRGTFVFDYGNNLRGQALRAGHPNPFTFDGFVPNYIRPLFCEGKGPFRWVALSGDPKDIEVTDEAISELFSNNKTLTRWLNLAQERVQFQGLPARICWLGYGEREKAGLLFNELVRSGKVKAPIVIGRDHLDCGSVASPYRETEKMKDGSDAIADWPVLNFGLAIASSASWVSLHHGGGVGMGYSIHSGVVVVADGTTYTDRKLKRVLNSDPAMGIIRHVDANYDEAKNAYFNAKKSNYLRFKIPSLEEKNHE
jgi:urocanate hydratase